VKDFILNHHHNIKSIFILEIYVKESAVPLHVFKLIPFGRKKLFKEI